ncbi:MAG TPA: hypothetical protein VJ820_11680 [Propionibacteriaceae bacterium]|nr:hypothetical protein [Propionibacteriaceae bacterium]
MTRHRTGRRPGCLDVTGWGVPYVEHLVDDGLDHRRGVQELLPRDVARASEDDAHVEDGAPTANPLAALFQWPSSP